MKWELAQQIGTYGFWWAKAIKGKEEELPSMQEILDGLCK